MIFKGFDIGNIDVLQNAMNNENKLIPKMKNI